MNLSNTQLIVMCILFVVIIVAMTLLTYAGIIPASTLVGLVSVIVGWIIPSPVQPKPATLMAPVIKTISAIGLIVVCLFALTVSGCGMTIQQLANADVVLSAGVVAGAQALWPSIYSLIPAADQPQAQKDFNVALLTVSTQAAVIQDGVEAMSTTDLMQQLALLDDAIVKIVNLINAYKNLSPDPMIQKSIKQLNDKCTRAHGMAVSMKIKAASGGSHQELRHMAIELNAAITQGMSL